MHEVARAITLLAAIGGCGGGASLADEAAPDRLSRSIAATSGSSPAVPIPTPVATASAAAPVGAPSPTPPTCAAQPPPGLTDLAERIPGVAFDLRYARADNFTGAALPGYGAATAWLADAPARALAEVDGDLRRRGLALVVFDAYRPRRATRAMVAWAEAHGRRAWVEGGYIARVSAHARGSAVDVGLVRAQDGALVDMGGDFDDFSPASHTLAARGEALANRTTLRAAMRHRGFVPYAREWWHFQHRSGGVAPLDVPYCGAL